jgi:hypothetical protein
MPVDEQAMGEDDRRPFPTVGIRVRGSVNSQGVFSPLVSGVECSSQKKGIFEDLIASDPTASDLETYRQAAANGSLGRVNRVSESSESDDLVGVLHQAIYCKYAGCERGWKILQPAAHSLASTKHTDRWHVRCAIDVPYDIFGQ